MSEAKKPEGAPGHYGAGYGEQIPEGAPPRPAPSTAEDTSSDVAPTGAAELEGVVITETVIVVQPVVASEASSDAGATGEGDDGAPVVFTPDDVHARPPDRPPTEDAPESEKAGLIFERS